MRQVVATAFALLVVACGGETGPSTTQPDSTTGVLISDDMLCRLHYGVSTKEDVIAALGSPDSVEGKENGAIDLIYRYTRTAGSKVALEITMVSLGHLYQHCSVSQEPYCGSMPAVLEDVVRKGNIPELGPVPACLAR